MSKILSTINICNNCISIYKLNINSCLVRKNNQKKDKQYATYSDLQILNQNYLGAYM